MKLSGIIKSKTREKILRFFFSNKERKYYLRELEKILSLPVGNIRRELISLEKLGLFKREKMGNLVHYYLNKNSPLFGVLENIIFGTENIEKRGESKRKIKKGSKNTDLMLIKKEDLNLLFSKISELENILETLFQKKVEIEDFLNLGVVLNNQGKVLLIKRVEQEKGKGKTILTWAFPGGKQRLNETRQECVEREVLSETGYKIESVREISSRFHPQFPVFIVYHLCRLVLPNPISSPKESHEIAEIRWVQPKEIKKMFKTDLDPGVSRELNL